MRVLVSGGTGLIGSHIVRRLAERGDFVTVLTRNPERARPELGATVEAVGWTPDEPGAWCAAVNDQDAVLHIAGEQAVGVRFTERRRQRLYASRVRAGELLARAIARADTRPRVYLTASAVGYYGSDAGVDPKPETAPPGDDFLAALCVAWENAASEARDGGVRTIFARFGIALAPRGGALPKMALPFRLGLGGRIGDKHLGFSWIHLEDLSRAVLFLLDRPDVEGAFNVCAPHPVSHAELARALGAALHRPAWFPAPKFALRMAFGREGARPLLGGQYVVPERLLGLGFRFLFPEIEGALSQCFRGRAATD